MRGREAEHAYAIVVLRGGTLLRARNVGDSHVIRRILGHPMIGAAQRR